MTDKEKAIIMAHTGICMLTGDKFQIFHKYVEDIMGRPIMTHELGFLEDEIKEKSKADFLALCADENSSENLNKWISVSEGLPKDRDWYLGIFKEPDTGWVNPIPFICDYVGSKTKTTTKEYWILRGFTDRDEHIDYYFNLECVAWRELPEQRK